MPKYLGPSDNLILKEGGKVYHPGDDVPITAALARHLSHRNQGGHRFEGGESASKAPAAEAESSKAAES